MAWDVDRLVTLSKHSPRIDVSLTNIREIDEPLGSDDDDAVTWRTVVEHVRLMGAADLSYPIILSSNGRVMDGMHRAAKALLLGRATIEGVRFAEDPEPDYVGVHPNDLPYDETLDEAANDA
jgi:hypothetical protein